MSTRHPEQVQRDLEELDRRRFKSLVPFAAAIVWVIAVSATGGDFVIFVLPKGTAVLIGAGLILISIVVSAVSWRCPVCERLLDERLYPKFCKHCKARLSGAKIEAGLGVPPGFGISYGNSPFADPFEEFRRRRNKAVLTTLPLVALLFGIWIQEGSISGFLGLGSTVVLTMLVCAGVFAGVGTWHFYRCPYCEKSPTQEWEWNPKECEECGGKLRP